MDPFLFMPKALPGRQHHLIRYRHFIWSRLFRELPNGEKTTRHHIVPKSFGVDTSIFPGKKIWWISQNYRSQPWNIIKLSYREHFIAHLMLAKAFEKGMFLALRKMSSDRGYSQIVSSRDFERISKKANDYISSLLIGRKKNLSEEIKIIKLERFRKTLNDRSSLEKEIISKNASLAQKRLNENRTEEDKEKIRQSNIKAQNRPEVSNNKRQKMLQCETIRGKHHGDKVKAGWSENYSEIISKICSNMWESLSVEERELRIFKWSHTNSGRKTINKDGLEKMVYMEEVEKYLTDGWTLGKTLSEEEISRRKIPRAWINNGNINKQIELSKLEGYIYLGWKRGRI